ncbi:MAG: 3-deoxy-7-phosphoheptulonate synthase [Candidatus Latescibacterota bacterium]|nr:MAG: 3-deoxy-7-phosphoheptulonate synthase [Candidatus Latescibacterota bacterium]
MILHLKRNASPKERKDLLRRLALQGVQVHYSPGSGERILAAIGDRKALDAEALDKHPAVARVVPLDTSFKLANREFRPGRGEVRVGDLRFGGKRIHVMAGPCSVENRADFLAIARELRHSGATILRGGAFKPRTSPYSFQGLGEEGLRILAEAREETGLLVVTEVMDTRDVELVCRYADIVQIGARNVQNFALLKEVGRARKPVLLKRGMMTTVNEYLMSAEYIMSGGNYAVLLCERGVRSFDPATRNMMDLAAVPLVHHWSHLPIIVDPSHGTGNWRWVPPLAKAGIAAGADGLMIEVHANPDQAYSDGEQSLLPERFRALMRDLKKIASVLGRTI